MPKLIHLHALKKGAEQSFSPQAHSEENASQKCVKRSLIPYWGSREAKYQSRLVGLHCASHLYAVMS